MRRRDLPLPEDFVGAVFAYVLNVKDWIDDVFVLKRTKTVLPAYAGEECAVAKVVWPSR